MADEALNYEEMLSALHGLFGEEVFAFVELRYDSGLRPLAMLRGVLSSAQDTDLSEFEGRVLRYPEAKHSSSSSAPSTPGSWSVDTISSSVGAKAKR